MACPPNETNVNEVLHRKTAVEGILSGDNHSSPRSDGKMDLGFIHDRPDYQNAIPGGEHLEEVSPRSGEVPPPPHPPPATSSSSSGVAVAEPSYRSSTTPATTSTSLPSSAKENLFMNAVKKIVKRREWISVPAEEVRNAATLPPASAPRPGPLSILDNASPVLVSSLSSPLTVVSSSSSGGGIELGGGVRNGPPLPPPASSSSSSAFPSMHHAYLHETPLGGPMHTTPTTNFLATAVPAPSPPSYAVPPPGCRYTAANAAAAPMVIYRHPSSPPPPPSVCSSSGVTSGSPTFIMTTTTTAVPPPPPLPTAAGQLLVPYPTTLPYHSYPVALSSTAAAVGTLLHPPPSVPTGVAPVGAVPMWTAAIPSCPTAPATTTTTTTTAAAPVPPAPPPPPPAPSLFVSQPGQRIRTSITLGRLQEIVESQFPDEYSLFVKRELERRKTTTTITTPTAATSSSAPDDERVSPSAPKQQKDISHHSPTGERQSTKPDAVPPTDPPSESGAPRASEGKDLLPVVVESPRNRPKIMAVPSLLPGESSAGDGPEKKASQTSRWKDEVPHTATLASTDAPAPVRAVGGSSGNSAWTAGIWKTYVKSKLKLYVFHYKPVDYVSHPSLACHIQSSDMRCSTTRKEEILPDDARIGQLLWDFYLRWDYLMPLCLQILADCIEDRAVAYGVPAFRTSAPLAWGEPPHQTTIHPTSAAAHMPVHPTSTAAVTEEEKSNQLLYRSLLVEKIGGGPHGGGDPQQQHKDEWHYWRDSDPSHAVNTPFDSPLVWGGGPTPVDEEEDEDVDHPKTGCLSEVESRAQDSGRRVSSAPQQSQTQRQHQHSDLPPDSPSSDPNMCPCGRRISVVDDNNNNNNNNGDGKQGPPVDSSAPSCPQHGKSVPVAEQEATRSRSSGIKRSPPHDQHHREDEDDDKARLLLDQVLLSDHSDEVEAVESGEGFAAQPPPRPHNEEEEEKLLPHVETFSVSVSAQEEATTSYVQEQGHEEEPCSATFLLQEESSAMDKAAAEAADKATAKEKLKLYHLVRYVVAMITRVVPIFSLVSQAQLRAVVQGVVCHLLLFDVQIMRYWERAVGEDWQRRRQTPQTSLGAPVGGGGEGNAGKCAIIASGLPTSPPHPPTTTALSSTVSSSVPADAEEEQHRQHAELLTNLMVWWSGHKGGGGGTPSLPILGGGGSSKASGGGGGSSRRQKRKGKLAVYQQDGGGYWEFNGYGYTCRTLVHVMELHQAEVDFMQMRTKNLLNLYAWWKDTVGMEQPK